MNKFTKNLLLIFAFIGVIGVVFYPKIRKNIQASAEKTSNKDAKSGEKTKNTGKASVKVWVVELQEINDVLRTNGTVLANEEVEIRSEISGKITDLLFNEGAFVKKGSILIHIYDDDLKAQLKKMEFSKRLAEENEYRQKKLLEKEAISQREYDVSLTNVRTIEADIENIKAQLTKTTIRSPFDGTIGLRAVSVGSYLSPNTKIATLTNVTPAKIDFSIPAKYATTVKKGYYIRFTVEDSEKYFTGTVYAIDPKIDPNTRTLQLRATSPNVHNQLIPGSFAKISLILASKGKGIQVPTQAIIPELSGHKVFVVKNGKAIPQSVEIGLRSEQSIEIKHGLQLGDSLVVSGILQLKPDAEVEIIN